MLFTTVDFSLTTKINAEQNLVFHRMKKYLSIAAISCHKESSLKRTVYGSEKYPIDLQDQNWIVCSRERSFDKKDSVHGENERSFEPIIKLVLKYYF